MITPAFNLTATERVLPRMALDFTTGVLDSRVTITRALNTATRVNSSGFVEIVNANLPRFDYDPATLAAKGLLIEEARTNIALYSEQFDNALWVKTNATITANATTSPDGTTNADKLIADAVLSQHRVNFTTVSTAGTYSFSVYLKAAGYNFALLRIGTVGGWVDLTNGAITGVVGGYTMTATLVGNGWYRVVLAGAAALNDILRINVSNTVLVTDFSGDGTSGIFLWGAQYEAGAFATSYIPTTTTSVTRNADSVNMTGTNFSSWYNASEGTIAVQGDALTVSNSNSMTICSLLLNSSNVTRFWMWSGQPANLRYGVVASGATSADIVKAITANTRFNAVGSYKTDLFQYALNAGATTADTSGAVPTGLTAFYIGSLDSVNEPLSGHIAKINFYPQSLTSNEVQAFSK